MRLPWAKRRTPERRSGGYHDFLLDAALRAAYGGTGAKASSTAAAESAAGLLGPGVRQCYGAAGQPGYTCAESKLSQHGGPGPDPARRDCLSDSLHGNGRDFDAGRDGPGVRPPMIPRRGNT